MTKYINLARSLSPGVMIAAVLALAAQFISEHYGAPTMLMALLLGMSLNFLSKVDSCSAGINFTSKKILRVGVALLGIRISLEMIVGLGLPVILIAVLSVVSTIVFGFFIAKAMKVDRSFAFLTSGSVAICGVSAAMAIAAILPKNEKQDERLIFTVAGVTVLSTVAMVLYPVLAEQFINNEIAIGVFLGATIHDVAQVVGAGYSVSEITGDTATVVKLLRVATLAPVIIIASLILRAQVFENVKKKGRPPLLPVFLIGFCVCVAIKSMGLIPSGLEQMIGTVSRWALVMAIAAVGMKINLGELRKIGGVAVVMIVSETVFVAVFIAIAVLLLNIS